MKENGVAYSLVKQYPETDIKKWLHYLERSITSLKKYMDIGIYVATNIPEKEIPFLDLIDKVLYIPFNECPVHRKKRKGMDYHIFKWKYLMPNSPFKRTLHLDADTFVVDNFDEVFSLLDRFDLATRLSVHYLNRRFDDVPEAFPELTGGYILWKYNTPVNRLFADILNLVSHRAGGTDEPFIRKALYHSDVRYSVIQNDYCVNYGHPQYLFGKAKVFHGQSDYIEEDAEIINHKVYQNFGPFKRLLFGNKIVFFKKKKQKVMFVKKEVPYHGVGWVQDVSEEQRKAL